MLKTEPTDYDLIWTKKIVENRADEWETNSPPEFYIRKENSTMVIVYRTEGIVYKRFIAN